MITNFAVNFINVYKDTFYFTDSEDADKIYRSIFWGAHVAKVKNVSASCLIADNSKLYYVEYGTDSCVYSIKLNGGGKSHINHGLTAGFNYADGWIYYIDKGDNNKLYRIKTNGTGKQKLCDMSCGEPAIVGKWIYFCNLTDNRYYRIKKDGTDLQKVK